MKSWGLNDELDGLKKQSLYRSRLVVDGAQGVKLQVGDRVYDNFSSNDYLGLANHPAVIAAFQKSVNHYGVGSGSAHLICGHSREHQQLEEELAAFTGRQRTLVFSTGYMANLGVISALLGKGDDVLQDKLNHASLLDGGKISGARLRRYSHGNMERLQQLLASTAGERKMVVTDGVFSMDGDEAPVNQLSLISAESEAMLMVDDAHGIGVLGKTGAGILEEHGLNQQQVPILMGTLGKALGTAGAFIAGSDELIETLIQRARSYIFTTAMPASVMAATRVSLKLCEDDYWRREKLTVLIHQFRQGAQQLGLQLMTSRTPIQTIILGSNERVMLVHAALKEKGFLVGAIRHPTVGKGSERLRITFSANHSEQQIDQLLLAIEGAMR